jgi:hypothetical protein
MKRLLTLYHESVPGHVETWYQNGDEVDIVGVYAQNYPRSENATLTGLEALRQFALMTSTEGWRVLDAEEWHDFVEGMSV